MLIRSTKASGNLHPKALPPEWMEQVRGSEGGNREDREREGEREEPTYEPVGGAEVMAGKVWEGRREEGSEVVGVLRFS